MDNTHPGYKKGTEPFFSIVMEGLKGEVDGESFWEAAAEDAVFDFMYHIPGFTNRFEGREAYRNWFAGYSMELHSADNLRVYKAEEGGVVILEYEVHGTVIGTGKAYDNRFCSIVTIRDRKIVCWRDYMDSLAVMLANS
ncbi:nuclear transport factor 2 family protein [Breznakiella homolactica]|uniref:Nuclear transport factor 2 family protein n=1 Tax=Breznakiella homolactica TaxID=2798577 RepID=A0A7T7XK06_9SPIR|nr:nuclear transport factor 2 family protein [Breznakiella homolactica]QQO07627.1 nuclear transport factor 2 family protein [Breznakiella homolactica]